jgi:hypothetical protein
MDISSASVRTTAAAIARVSFGLALVCVGLIHYLQFASFSEVVRSGLGPLEIVGTLWSVLLPAVYIIGGALFALNLGTDLAAWLIGIGLGSIAPGMLLKSVLTGVDMTDMMAAANNAFIWLGIFLLILVVSAHAAPARLSAPAPAAAVPAKKPAPAAKPKRKR